MRFNNSKIQKLSILIIFIAASFVLLLLYQRYFTCIGVFVFLIAVCRFWYLELIEELIIACLKKAGGKKDVNSILSEFQKQGELALSRLSGKNIVEIENNIVRLIDVNRPNPFGK